MQAAPPVITALDGHSLNIIGQVSDLWHVDSTNLLFGIANRGLSFVDAVTSISLSAAGPVFAAAPTAQPVCLYDVEM